jgi:hypothetical protein
MRNLLSYMFDPTALWKPWIDSANVSCVKARPFRDQKTGRSEQPVFGAMFVLPLNFIRKSH